MEKISYIVNLLIISILLLIVAVNRNGKIGGEKVKNIFQTEKEVSPIKELADGTIEYNSANIVKGISGYGGSTPIIMKVRNNIIREIRLGKNSETKEYLSSILNKNPWSKWENKTLDEASKIEVDAVTGATLSSSSISETLKRTIAFASNQEVVSKTPFSLRVSDIAGLLIILIGVIFTFYKPKTKWIRIVYLVMNIAILGFWCGSFLSLSKFVGWMSNGINIASAIVPFALLCVAVILPFFGKKGTYCANHCAMGSFQELIGRSVKYKITLSKRLQNVLGKVCNIILMALLFLMWIGVGFRFMNYEVFSAFMITHASTFVLVMGIIFLFLSAFITRPYCRFVCPTGALLRLSQKTKK